MPSEMKRRRELEQENARLKKIVADLVLERFGFNLNREWFP